MIRVSITSCSDVSATFNMNFTRVSVVFLVLKLVFCDSSVSDGSDFSDSFSGISGRGSGSISSAGSGSSSAGSGSSKAGSGSSSAGSGSSSAGSGSSSAGSGSSSAGSGSSSAGSGSSSASSSSSGSYPERNNYNHYNVHHTNMYPFDGYTPTLGMACKTFLAVNNRGGHIKAIKQITIIDESGSVLYESMPQTSQINFSNNPRRFYTVRRNVGELIKCRVVVGHNLKECLKLLNIYHPKYLLRDTNYFCKNNSNIIQDKDSFKHIAKEFLNVDINEHNTTVENAITAMRVYKKFQREWEIHVSKEDKPAFALDCEMVECRWPNKTRVENVVRISVVDHKGDVLYDKIIKPELPVSDYRTFITGLRRNDFVHAENFAVAKERIRLLLKGQIVVGHAVWHDLLLLGIKHPVALSRDSSLFLRFRRFSAPKMRPSLKELAKHYLNMSIQRKAHDSVQDALTCMLLYLKFRIEWDEDALRRMDSGDSMNDTELAI